jgi:hypothetical protein
VTLKDCLYQTLHRNNKPLKLIAEEIGMSENYLYRSALPDPDESDTGTGCRFPLKKLVPLVRCTADFSVLDFIEQSLGRVAFPLPAPSSTLSDLSRLAMISVREFGQLMAEMEADMADGKIFVAEKVRIRKEGYEAVQAIVNLLQHLEK